MCPNKKLGKMASNNIGNGEERQQRIEQFVNKNFKQCRCRRYVRIDFHNEKSPPSSADFASYVEDDGAVSSVVIDTLSNTDSDDCACGRPLEWHVAKHFMAADNENGGKYWTPSGDTKQSPCNTHGNLMFVPGEGYDSSTIEPLASAYYIRFMPADNKLSTLYENINKLLIDKQYWSLPRPHFLIEVCGTTRKFHHVDRDILERFTSGLIKAANTAKAWIVTSGTNDGVNALVGNALSKWRMAHTDCSITCLGIASWGMVNNREQLLATFDDEDRPVSSTKGPFGLNVIPASTSSSPSTVVTLQNDGLKPISSAAISLNNAPAYCVERPENCRHGISLNPGHNCFLLIDNGREKRRGEELAFRANFLHHLAQKPLYGTIGSQVVPTPLVLVVVGGGIMTLKTVELSIASRDTIFEDGEAFLSPKKYGSENVSRPAFILANFGGASDLLAFAYELTASSALTKSRRFSEPRPSDETNPFPSDFDSQIMAHPEFEQILQATPPEFRREESIKAIRRIRNCIKFRHMLTIVDLNDSRLPLDHAILNAVLCSNFCAPTSAFELALLWNRIDVAKQLLMRHEKEISVQLDMKGALTRAIMYDQSDFFKLLVEYDLVDLHSYLTRYKMRCFYTDIFLKRVGKPGKLSCIWLFRSLLHNLTTEEALADVTNPKLLQLLGQILSSLLGCYMDNVFTDEPSYRRALDSLVTGSSNASLLPSAQLIVTDMCPYDTSMRDLLILQLLLYRRDIAVYVWLRGHDHLGTALMAAIFLKSLTKEANRLDMTDLGAAYKELSHEWRTRSIELLASCYEQDPLICSRLLTRSLQTWQGATILEIAFYGKMKKFMEQPAVQTTLKQVWMGHLTTFTQQRLIYLALFPPLLPFLLFRLRFEKAKTIRLRTSFPSAAIRQQATPKVTPIPASVRSPHARPHSSRQSETPQILRIMTPYASSADRQDVKLARAVIFNVTKEGNISLFQAVYLLYSSPIAKYAVHSVTVVAFLFLFSCFLLDPGQQSSVGWVEIVIWICCIVYFLDVVRDGFGKTNLTVLERMQDFFSNASVLAEIVGLCLVLSAAVLRLLPGRVGSVETETIYSLACVLYWLKSLSMFFVTESIGPKVITLFNMFRDVLLFVFIYVILLLAFSVPIHVLLYPYQHMVDAESYFGLLGNISLNRMWNLFVVDMDNSRNIIEGTCKAPSAMSNTSLVNQLTKNPTSCSMRNGWAKALYIIFLLLTNIMLLNMLIAMFAHTVDKTRLSATRLWRFDMYRFLYDYYSRPVLPGPFMIFELVYRFCFFINQQTCGKQLLENTDLKHFYGDLDDYNYRKMEMFERSAAETILPADAYCDRQKEFI